MSPDITNNLLLNISSELTSSAYKKLASIFKNASVENERSTRELVGRLADAAVAAGEAEVRFLTRSVRAVTGKDPDVLHYLMVGIFTKR